MATKIMVSKAVHNYIKQICGAMAKTLLKKGYTTTTLNEAIYNKISQEALVKLASNMFEQGLNIQDAANNIMWNILNIY